MTEFWDEFKSCDVDDLERAYTVMRHERKAFPRPAEFWPYVVEAFNSRPVVERKQIGEAKYVSPEKSEAGLKLLTLRTSGQISQEELEKRMEELFPGSIKSYKEAQSGKK